MAPSFFMCQKYTKFEKLLLQRKDEIEASLKSFKELSRPVDLNTPIGRLSRMDAMQEQQLMLENKRKAEISLLQIASALKRIIDGTYGVCLKCEEDISEKRLMAKPETLYCIECQNE